MEPCDRPKVVYYRGRVITVLQFKDKQPDMRGSNGVDIFNTVTVTELDERANLVPVILNSSRGKLIYLTEKQESIEVG